MYKVLTNKKLNIYCLHPNTMTIKTCIKCLGDYDDDEYTHECICGDCGAYFDDDVMCRICSVGNGIETPRPRTPRAPRKNICRPGDHTNECKKYAREHRGDPLCCVQT